MLTSLSADAVCFMNYFNTLRPRQNGRHSADDIITCIFLNKNIWILIKISLKFVPKGPINNIPALVQIMAWHRPGDKPLFDQMLVSLLTHMCVTRPQWVKILSYLILSTATILTLIMRIHYILIWQIDNCNEWGENDFRWGSAESGIVLSPMSFRYRYTTIKVLWIICLVHKKRI